ncbi:NB-ARC domain-containing protein [Streptomyces sp. NPDC018610]|uniref:NB-ARC domain-containing protein n=1 Tax=Streptomyces sp. NPDC018610 TaxID=3365049 RepID=UPI0037A196E9
MLVRAREAACLTQGELAERSGLSVRAIRNLETGHTARPRKQSLLLLAEALGLPAGEAGRLLRLPRTEQRPAPAPVPPGTPAPHRASASAPPLASAPAELPAAPRHRLVGREALVEDLMGHLAHGEPGPGRPAAAVVVGPPGAGKTSLVLRTAHGVREEFPDGQVFVDLHSASGLPFTSDSLVRRVLRSLGAAPAAEHPEEARAQLRNALSGRRVLVVLDNVDGEAQVRPLLVDDGRSAVLVAARRELPALPAQSRHRIGALDESDAYRALEDLVGADRVRAQRSAALSIVRSCAGLPLALHIAGLWLTARPHRSLHDLAARLADERDRLRSLRIGDLSLHASVRAYHRLLPPPLRTALRQLEPLEGDFGLEEMTARVTPSRRLAMDLLEELLHRQMIHPTDHPHRLAAPRYRLYDAVRLYMTHDTASPEARSAALEAPAALHV